MLDTSRIMYIHGSDSDSNSGKARQFREWFPGIVTPDFKGSFEERMRQLYEIVGDSNDWILIGSSYGGLMATIFALDHADQLRKLVLLAPALMLDPVGTMQLPTPVFVPTIVIHGTLDTVVLLEPVRAIAQKLFTNLTYHIVADDHRLYQTANNMDWASILN